MDRDRSIPSLDQMAESVVQDGIKQQVSTTVQGEIKTRMFGASEEKKDSHATLSHKSDKIAKNLLALFRKSFNEEQCQKLGIEIKETSGGWFTSGSVDITVHASGDAKVGAGMQCSIQLPKLLDDLVSQYLAEKHERRAEDSFLSVNYKSFIARLIRQIVNAIYNRKLSRQEQILYLENLDEFLSLIRQEDALFASEQAQEASHLHFEGFLIEAQQRISDAAIELRTLTDAHQMHAWLTEWQLKIGEVLRIGVPWFHFAVQTKPVPKNLPDQLQKLGAAYQRQLEGHIKKRFDGCIKFKPERLKHWHKIKAMTQAELAKFYVGEEISETLLLDAVKKKRISWEQYYFYSLDSGYYTPDQLLWELLNNPDELPLSKAAIKDSLCYTKVLNLYRSSDPEEQHHWFLHLKSDLQLLHYPSARLIRICEEPETESTEALIVALSKLIETGSTSELEHSVPLGWHPGILREIQSLVTGDCPQIPRVWELLALIQQSQAKLSYVWNLLDLYRKLLPSTGELIGAIALGPHLQSCVELVNAHGRQLQASIFELNQLLRYGNHLQDSRQVGLQSILLQYPVSKFERSKAQNIRYWLKTENLRYRQGNQLFTAVAQTVRLSRELSQHCSPDVLMSRVKMSERLFNIADHLSGPILSEEAKQKRPSAQAVMHQFGTLVRSGITASQPISKDQKAKVGLTTPSADSFPLKDSVLTPPVTILIHSRTTLEVNDKMKEIKTHAFTIETLLTDTVISVLALLSDPKIESKVIQSKLELLITSKQEEFFTEFSKVKAQHADHEWIRFFHLRIGFLYSPLPQLENPKKFRWWYQNTITDRSLFFRSLCISCLTETIKQNPQNSIALERYQHFIFLEQESAHQECASRSAWFDRFRSQIRSKFNMWHIRTKQYGHETKRLVASDERPKNPELDRATTLQSSSLPQTETLVTDIKLETSRQPKSEVQVTSPIDLAPESLEWKQYQDILEKSSEQQKQIYCLLFFQAALLRIERSQLSISKNTYHAKQCHRVILLFLQVLKPTTLATSLLAVSLESLDETFKNNTSAVQHQFFVKKGKKLLESYSQVLLPAVESSSPMPNQ